MSRCESVPYDLQNPRRMSEPPALVVRVVPTIREASAKQSRGPLRTLEEDRQRTAVVGVTNLVTPAGSGGLGQSIAQLLAVPLLLRVGLVLVGGSAGDRTGHGRIDGAERGQHDHEEQEHPRSRNLPEFATHGFPRSLNSLVPRSGDIDGCGMKEVEQPAPRISDVHDSGASPENGRIAGVPNEETLMEVLNQEFHPEAG